jgi:hypothetical protein
MVQCPACHLSYVVNTVFCPECGLYLLESEELGTDPLETGPPEWSPGANDESGRPATGLLSIRLRIRAPRSSNGPADPGSTFRLAYTLLIAQEAETCLSMHRRNRVAARELEVPLKKPIRLGRMDPKEGVYPDVDLTADLAMEHGVSREHACIFRRGNSVEVEDLASTNGTRLNGKRLSPYLPVPLQDGDQLHLGKLLIEVSFGENRGRNRTTETRIAPAAIH